MSSKHGLWAWQAETEDSFQRDVLVSLAFRLDKSGDPIQIRLRDIMSEARHNKLYVRNAIKRLVECGYLAVERHIGGKDGDTYRLDFEKIQASTRCSKAPGKKELTGYPDAPSLTLLTGYAEGRGHPPPTGYANALGDRGTETHPVRPAPGVQEHRVALSAGYANAGGHVRDSRPSRAGDFVLNALKATATAKAKANTNTNTKTKTLSSADAVRTHSERANENENSLPNPATNSPEIFSEESQEFSPDLSRDFVSKTPLNAVPVSPDSPTLQSSEKCKTILIEEARQHGKLGALMYVDRFWAMALSEAKTLWGVSEHVAATRLLDRRRKYMEYQPEAKFQATLDNWLNKGTWQQEPISRNEVKSNGGRGGNGTSRGPIQLSESTVRAAFEQIEAEERAADGHLDGDEGDEEALRAAGRAHPPANLSRRPGTPVIQLAGPSLLRK